MAKLNISECESKAMSGASLTSRSACLAAGLGILLASGCGDDGYQAFPEPVENEQPAPRSDTPNGIQFPLGYQDWPVIGVSRRIDNNTLRVILGNQVAVEASRNGETNPWPKDAVVGKLVWKEKSLPTWEPAMVPGEFVHAEFMIRDGESYADTDGWGYARWTGLDEAPYGEADYTGQECVDCHSPVKENDYVFTIPALLPSIESGNDVPKTINGIEFPKGYQDWPTIAVSHRTDNNTIRVIIGNETAIEASREGNTNPWPKGSIIGKVVWKDMESPDWKPALVPNELVHAEFMFKDDELYAETGGWGWARWVGDDQTPYGDTEDTIQECVACHTPVADNDYVFTEPAMMPRLLSAP